MQQVTIANLILNSPFEELSRHFRFRDEAVGGRCRSERCAPFHRPTKRAVRLPVQRARTVYWLEPNPACESTPGGLMWLHADHVLAVLPMRVEGPPGPARIDKATRVSTARGLCVLPVNEYSGLGRWALEVIGDPLSSGTDIRRAAMVQ